MIIENVQPISAVALFDLLKKEFTNDINAKLDSSLDIDYAHVYDVINISFPELTEKTVFTITVNENELELSNNSDKEEYNTELIEKHLVEFLKLKCS